MSLGSLSSLTAAEELEKVQSLLFKAELTSGGGLSPGDSLGMSLQRSAAAMKLSLPAWPASTAPRDRP